MSKKNDWRKAQEDWRNYGSPVEQDYRDDAWKRGQLYVAAGLFSLLILGVGWAMWETVVKVSVALGGLAK